MRLPMHPLFFGKIFPKRALTSGAAMRAFRHPLGGQASLAFYITRNRRGTRSCREQKLHGPRESAIPTARKETNIAARATLGTASRCVGLTFDQKRRIYG
jgi:hypothetical protein